MESKNTEESSIVKIVDTVYYHTGCPDGIGAAWCMYRAMLECDDIDPSVMDFIPISPGGKNFEFPIHNEGDERQTVVFVDVCPSFDVLKTLSETSDIMVIDHHKTTVDDVIPLVEACNDVNTRMTFDIDMTRSAAQMVWDTMFPDKCRPKFIDYIADRDLWKWELPDTREINAVLYDDGHLRSIENLEKFYIKTLDDPSIYDKMVEKGKIISDTKLKLAKQTFHRGVLTRLEVGDTCYMVNITGCTTPAIRSDVGNMLAVKTGDDGEYVADFSATYVYDYNCNSWWISLRGNPDSPDLSAISTQFGGGGHAKAAGFEIDASMHSLRDIFTPIVGTE